MSITKVEFSPRILVPPHDRIIKNQLIYVVGQLFRLLCKIGSISWGLESFVSVQPSLCRIPTFISHLALWGWSREKRSVWKRHRKWWCYLSAVHLFSIERNLLGDFWVHSLGATLGIFGFSLKAPDCVKDFGVWDKDLPEKILANIYN